MHNDSEPLVGEVVGNCFSFSDQFHLAEDYLQKCWRFLCFMICYCILCVVVSGWRGTKANAMDTSVVDLGHLLSPFLQTTQLPSGANSFSFSLVSVCGRKETEVKRWIGTMANPT